MLEKYTLYVLAATVVIPCAAGLVNYRNLSIPVKFITWLFVFSFITEAAMTSLSHLHIRNLFAMHLFALVEIIFVSLYFYHLVGNTAARKILVASSAVLTAFAIAYAISGNNFSQFNSIPRAVECGYFTVLSLWLFYEMSLDASIDTSHYLINGSILFYFSSSFLVFAFSRYKEPDTTALMVMFSLHAVINTFCNLTYATGIWLSSKRYYTQA